VDAKRAGSTANAGKADDGHVHGDVLLSVAEGDAASQPDEATLAHIFSCDQCSQNVRDIRSGLAALGVKPGGTKKTAAPAAATMATMPVLPMSGGPTLPPEPVLVDETADRSRGMIWKIVLVGAVLGGALFYLRTFASSLH